MNKKISIIGIGMNGIETMIPPAVSAVENAELLIGAKRMIKMFDRLKKPFFASYISSEIAEFISKCEYKNIAVLMSGDCGFYSGAEKLLPFLSEYETEVVSGISSPIYFCSKLKMSWFNLHFVSLHGVNGNIVRNVCSHEKTFFLLGGGIEPKNICERLCEYDFGKAEVYIGENLGLENEKITNGSAEHFKDIKTDKLCVMIVKNPNYEKYLRSGISDSEFIRGNVPMTKSEVRNICVSMLEIGVDNVCWDIGSGTGSVSVEMAMRCTNGTVYAVEKNIEAVLLTDKNRHKFGCDNIEIINDNAENAILNLPVPDCVFIGGSGGKLEEIITLVYQKNPNAKIIVTAVSFETLNKSISVFENLGVISEVSQIAVTRTKKIGTHRMLSAENPIFIIRGNVK